MKLHSFISAIILSGALLSGTASAQNSMRPTDESSDEAGLWYAVDKIEESVRTSGLRVTDPDLVDYAQRVTCKVTGPDCDQVRLYIINAPYFNASMYPNGMMLLNSGLLLRADNEAQLACVIGHEYGHFKEQHSLERWRRAKTIANASILLNFAGAYAGAGRETSLSTAIAGLVAQQSFSREHEREADLIGFEMTGKAGYAASECSSVWGNVISETQASDFRRIRNRATKGNFLSSHPVPTERQQTLAELAQANPGGSLTNADGHASVTRRFTQTWLRTELLAQDYPRHIHLFEALKGRGYSEGLLDYYIGEAYRLRRDDGDEARAFAAFERAASSPDVPALVHRALGEHYRRQGESQKALASYQTYLARNPNAEDKVLIARYIDRLEGER